MVPGIDNPIDLREKDGLIALARNGSQHRVQSRDAANVVRCCSTVGREAEICLQRAGSGVDGAGSRRVYRASCRRRLTADLTSRQGCIGQRIETGRVAGDCRGREVALELVAGKKEKELVSDDGTAHCATVLLANIGWFEVLRDEWPAGRQLHILDGERIECSPLHIAIEEVGLAVKLVAAALGDG